MGSKSIDLKQIVTAVCFILNYILPHSRFAFNSENDFLNNSALFLVPLRIRIRSNINLNQTEILCLNNSYMFH